MSILEPYPGDVVLGGAATVCVARQIRVDRRVAEDEVVRVTLQDKDEALLFEGDVR